MSKRRKQSAEAEPPESDSVAAEEDQPAAEQDAEEFGLGGFQQPAEQGLSLDQLSGAFAELLTSGTDPYADPEPETDADGHPVHGPETAEDPVEVSPRTILEAMLFIGHPNNSALTSREVAGLMRGVRPAEIDDLVKELNEQYAADGCPYHIVGEGAGYRMVLKESYDRMREKLVGRSREVTLSQAAIETLSIVAYNQPVTRDDVSKLRGHPSGPVLSQLVRRQLIRLERPEEKPRTPRYYTTDRFLQLFGLKSLEDLPRSDDDLDKQ